MAYLTDYELKMSNEEVNLQIVLALQTATTKEDAMVLLNEIRRHELSRVRKAMRELCTCEIPTYDNERPPLCPACRKMKELNL